jgi:ketosteroid isomerase-like protein
MQGEFGEMHTEIVSGIVSGVDDDAREIWAAVNAVYAGFLAGDREAIDANIARDATIWDSAHEPLVRGREALDALRDARPAQGPRPVALDATDPVIDVFGDVAVVRHVLVVEVDGGPPQRIRNTSVWRRLDGRWLCVHNHEDVV